MHPCTGTASKGQRSAFRSINFSGFLESPPEAINLFTPSSEKPRITASIRSDLIRSKLFHRQLEPIVIQFENKLEISVRSAGSPRGGPATLVGGQLIFEIVSFFKNSEMSNLL